MKPRGLELIAVPTVASLFDFFRPTLSQFGCSRKHPILKNKRPQPKLRPFEACTERENWWGVVALAIARQAGLFNEGVIHALV